MRNFDLPDTRQDFNKTWLFETPERTMVGDLAKSIEDGSEVLDLGNGLKKIEGMEIVYYWYEKDNQFLLGIELFKSPQALITNSIGKKNKGEPPYASDLYDAILNDRKNMSGNSIRITSDKQLSDEGLNIWKKLLSQGHKISVYDADNPGKSYTIINSEDDLNDYFGNDKRLRRWQYVLSESDSFCDVLSFFRLRRTRELSGMCLE